VFWSLLFWKAGAFALMFLITALLLLLLSFPLYRYVLKNSLFSSKADWFVGVLEKNLGIEIPRNIINISQSNKKTVNTIYFSVIMVISFLSGMAWKSDFMAIASFINQVSFNLTDPIFQNDISFYLFSLPLLKPLWGLFGGMTFLVLLITTIVYLLGGDISMKSLVSKRVRKHFFFLLSLLAIWFTVRLVLGSYDLLYSGKGIVFGAGYADIYGDLLALRVSAMLAGLLALFFIINIFANFSMKIGTPVVAILILIFIANTFYPAALQKFVVSPNEVAKETPFINHNIEYTNYAYQLDKTKVSPFDYQEGVFNRKILRDTDFINNIRIWDPTPLKQTYKQLQGIRLYYEFNDVDVDRYEIDGVKKGMTLSARELASWKIPQRAKTWVNEKLKYTHGYGIVANYMSAVMPNGMPRFSIKDIPPKSKLFQINRPEIYFGELTKDYVIVNTKAKEFDYPKGDGNSYTKYEGQGGVKLDSFWKKVLFALKFNDMKILISNYITPESRILYYRDINQRVEKLMPMVNYDNDPYVVIRKDGSLAWIIDGYSISNRFPYSEPFTKRLNYMRNSVKVVIDAYTGEVSYYLADNEPIINTYANIFKGVFKPISEMPDDLKSHVRYPEAFFYVQAKMYQTYHIKNPEVFYNMEDLWNFPQETYSGKRVAVQPRYLFLKRGTNQMRYVLAMPYTPNSKDNMIAYLYSDCDDMSLNLLQFPKGKLIYGPMQIEARIDQHPDISKELTLWSQKGSQVIRGNLLTLPLEHNVLYVEPIYLQAEQSRMPELKRVVVAMGDRVVMRETLRGALVALFDGLPVSLSQRRGQTVKELVENVYNIFLKAENAAKQSSWEDFGKGLNDLKGGLKTLKKKVSE